MSDDQEHGAGQPAALPKADGPLVDVTLPDGQHLYAVVKSRRREPDGWWYDLQIHLPSQGSDRGRLLVLPAAIDFRAPAALCQPIDGQPYDQIPTERPGTTPAWKVEEPVSFGTQPGPGPHRAPRRLPRRPRPHPARQHRAGPRHPDAPRRRTLRHLPTRPAPAHRRVARAGAGLVYRRSSLTCGNVLCGVWISRAEM